VKSKYAGVTLDWYDDELATLKAKFPAADQLPDIIKEANVKPSDRVANEEFALVALDEGNVLRKYACHDPGTTAMSVIYFMEHGDKLPEGAQKMAAANLVEACQKFGLAAPKAMEKLAGLGSAVLKGTGIGAGIGGLGLGGLVAARAPEGKRLERGLKAGLVGAGVGAGAGLMGSAAGHLTKEIMSGGKQLDVLSRMKGLTPGSPQYLAELQQLGIKLASRDAIDITGQSPKPKVKLAWPDNDADYAVVLQDGSRHYPIDTWDRVKLAEDYYQENRLRMEPRVRRQYAVKLAAKAIHLGYPLDYEIFEKGACTYAKPGQMKAALEMRKVACAPGEEREWLDELFEKRAHLEPGTYAACLHRFDVEKGLDRGWDRVVLDPWESTFGINKTAEVVWEQGADRVTDDQLQNLAQNQHSGLQEMFREDFTRQFIKDPIGIFNSMPDPQKKIIARMANDQSSQGGSEVAVAG